VTDREEGPVALAGIAEALALYYKMWTGRTARLGGDEDRIGVDREDTLSLPSECHRFGDAAEGRTWYLVAVTHRAAHIEFSTFDAPVPPSLAASFGKYMPPSLRGDLTLRTSRDLLEVLGSIDHRRQGLFALVRALEDYRVDEGLKRMYRGLRGSIVEMQHEAASVIAGQAPAGLPPRTRFARLVSQMSLDVMNPRTALEPVLHEPFRNLVHARESLSDSRATVLDSIGWGLRLWSMMLRLPNMQQSYGEAAPVDLTGAAAADSRGPGIDAADGRLGVPALEVMPRLEGSDVLSVEIGVPEYRDSLAVSIARHAPAPTPADALLVFEGDSDLATDSSADLVVPAAAKEQELPWERPPEPLPHEHAHEDGDPGHHEHGELRKHGPADFIYPEWDAGHNSYRQSWVRVREIVAPGETKTAIGSKAEASIRAYGSVCRRLRGELEAIVPAGITRVSGFPWGDEIDLDAGIQLMVDRRCGRSGDERVYEVQVRGRRDVVAALLLDVSCSTAERREPSGGASGDRGTGESLTWAEARSPVIAAKGYRTLLDGEVEMASVMSSAISQIGDGFGLYAFSGSGRSDVRFSVLKEIGERWGPAVHRRLDRLRPVYSTRMGAAIRHATRKLARWDAATKILLLLSDGRPFDIDYGPPGAHGHAEFDPEYAWGDTSRAIEECERWNVGFGAITTNDDQEVLSQISSAAAWAKCEDVEDLPEGVTSVFHRLISQAVA
jgi:nitric oxide reductase NorD protein